MFSDAEIKHFTKKARRTTVTPLLKRRIWDLYIGPGVKQQLCPLCNVYQISLVTNSGYEAAHIVADKYMTEELTHHYVYPSCASCNNECRNMCILDYLFTMGRMRELRTVIGKIYRAFDGEPQYAWKVLEHLYGPARFPAGGGLVNTKAVYEIARGEQLLVLGEEMTTLSNRLAQLASEFRDVSSAEIKTLKF